MPISQTSLQSMMSRDSSTREADVDHSGDVSSTQGGLATVPHQAEVPPEGGGSDKASRSNSSPEPIQGLTPEGSGNAGADISKDGTIAISTTNINSVGTTLTSDTKVNSPVSPAVTTHTSNDTTSTTNTALLSGAATSATTSTSRRRCPPSPPRSQPLRPSMGLRRPTIGVNGHALPRGAGDSRDAPRNPSALPTGPSDSTVRHRERLIGHVTACVAPPPLRISDAQRERGRLVSVSQRLMSRPVKRKLWEVDQEKLGPEIEKEYKQMIEEDQRRFKERWEELGPEVNPDAPAFYRSEVTPSKRRNVAPASSESADLPPRPSLSETANTGGEDCPQKDSDASESTPRTEVVGDDSGKKVSSSSSDSEKRASGCSEEESKQPETPSEVNLKKLAVGQVVSLEDNRPSETSSSKASSESSTMTLLNSSTVSTSSSSSTSGAFSLETTPTHKSTKYPPSAGTCPQEETPRSQRMAPSEERILPPPRPSTRSSRRRSSSQRVSPGPRSQKHLRM